MNTIKAIVDLYDNDFRGSPGYKKIPWTDVKTWDFTELSCASKEYLDGYFSQKRFFDSWEPMPGFVEVINRLREKYKIVFCSIGTPANLKLKEDFLIAQFGNVVFDGAEIPDFMDDKNSKEKVGFVGININDFGDKSHINANNCVIVDDRWENLTTSNANLKVLFGADYPWNANWTGLHCYDWYDFERSLPRWIE
jgi:5'(3')-deoxyribonucleotidase